MIGVTALMRVRDLERELLQVELGLVVGGVGVHGGPQ